MEAGQRDELELVAHRAELALELGDRGVVELRLPVERRRAVVGQQLARELRVDRLGELLGLGEVRARRFRTRAGRRRERRPGRGRWPTSRPPRHAVEAFGRALAGEERPVARVDVAGQQVGAVGVGARDQDGRHVHHVGGQARGDRGAG